VIVNPCARSGAGPRALTPLRTGPPPGSPISVEWSESRSGAHLGDLVAAAMEEPFDAVAVAGGDGSVALALDAMGRGPDGGRRPPLGILPVGAGNDFATDLGIPRRAREAFRVLLEGATRRVDVLEDIAGNRVGCLATVGFDALALPIVHSGLPRSKALNIYAAIHALLRYRPRPLRVTWAGGEYQGPLTFAAAANTRSYGGGFRITPAARLDDGLLDICLVKATGPARLLQLFSQVMSGNHVRSPEVIMAQSPWVRIEGTAGELPVAFDGELPARATPIELTCRPAAALVVAPGPDPNVDDDDDDAEAEHVAA
jgi:diacylglycerol kinase (ATP)